MVDDGGRRARRDAAVRRLVTLSKAGPLSRTQVTLTAQSLSVSERTVRRWIAQAQAGDGVEPVAEASQSAQPMREPAHVPPRVGAALPDPGQAATLDDLVERLRSLKAWAGSPSYDTIKNRVNKMWSAAGLPAAELVGKTTVVDCFRPGRRRMNADLVMSIVQALHPDPGYVAQWRQALQVIVGETTAASQVRVQDCLPPDLAGFTGRTAELDRLRRVLADTGRDGGAVVISAIEGMAGVGKTQLAIHLGHLLLQEQSCDRVLFVNLRGFHPDRACQVVCVS